MKKGFAEIEQVLMDQIEKLNIVKEVNENGSLYEGFLGIEGKE